MNRRSFLTGMAGSGTAFYILPSGCASIALAEETTSGPTHGHPLGFFTDTERETLTKLCDQILPGAASIGSVFYIETLLTAFESTPPKIFAGGPSSGRDPFSKNRTARGPDDFNDFHPLNRVQEATWRLRLYGSSSVKGGYWNEHITGPIVGLRTVFKQGLADAAPRDQGEPVLGWTSKEFRTALTELVVESCFGAPEYGGNAALRGWRLAHYEGDSQPLGFSIFDEATQTYSERPDFPVSKFDAKDPQKMSFFTRTFCSVITLARGGRFFK